MKGVPDSQPLRASPASDVSGFAELVDFHLHGEPLSEQLGRGVGFDAGFHHGSIVTAEPADCFPTPLDRH